jgi:hypothetical protein
VPVPDPPVPGLVGFGWATSPVQALNASVSASAENGFVTAACMTTFH